MSLFAVSHYCSLTADPLGTNISIRFKLCPWLSWLLTPICLLVGCMITIFYIFFCNRSSFFIGSICLSKQAWAIEPDSCTNEWNQVWFTQHTFRCPSKRVSAWFKLGRGQTSCLIGNLRGCSLDCGSGSCTTAVQHAELLSRSGFLTHFSPVFHLFHFWIHSTRCTRWHNSRVFERQE